jgi:hypothetical protein
VVLSIKFQCNYFSGSRDDACGQTEQIGLTKQIGSLSDCQRAKNAKLNRPSVSLKMTVFWDLRPVGWWMGARGGVVVEALRYKPKGRRIDSQWCNWNFSLT